MPSLGIDTQFHECARDSSSIIHLLMRTLTSTFHRDLGAYRESFRCRSQFSFADIQLDCDFALLEKPLDRSEL